MTGLYPISARYDDDARPNRLARAAAEVLYERMRDGGYSERELCTIAGVTRRSCRV